MVRADAEKACFQHHRGYSNKPTKCTGLTRNVHGLMNHESLRGAIRLCRARRKQSRRKQNPTYKCCAIEPGRICQIQPRAT
jgi:hypothetical protein